MVGFSNVIESLTNKGKVEHPDTEHISQHVSNFVYIHGVVRPLFGGKSRSEIMVAHQQIMKSAAEEWALEAGKACLATEAKEKSAQKKAADAVLVPLDGGAAHCVTPGTSPDQLPLSLMAATGSSKPAPKPKPFSAKGKAKSNNKDEERHTTPEAFVDFMENARVKTKSRWTLQPKLRRAPR